MFKRPFTLSEMLFFGSALLPYLLDLFPPHSGGSHSLETLFFDFIALLMLGISSLVLAVGNKELRSNGKGLIYLAIAPATVILYFYSLNLRVIIREQIEFYLRKPVLEARVAQLNRGFISH